MNSRNMLSAKNVRLHGMHDERWTMNDQMLQYRGLVKLYKRDQKIMNADIAVAERKQKFELKEVKKDIEASRTQLQNVVIGDKQVVRNALAEHKHMQLAYQELPTLQVINHIYQNNFTKRKQQDLLNFRTKERTQVLVDLKLRKALLEDRIKYQLVIVPEVKIAERITGKVQDAVLKKEAALVVHEAYANILDIMKKDTLYYDAILDDLKRDAKSQGQCMIHATQIGQLAMEYLDDRKSEYEELEVVVKIDMKQRLEDLKVVSDEMERIQSSMRLLIRKDSDINCGLVTLPPEFSNKDLAFEVQEIERILSNLQSITMVTSYENIYLCFSEQLRQKFRLDQLQQKKSADFDSLLNKLDHATTMKHMLENTMIETTEAYMSEKQRIANELAKERDRKKDIEKRMEVKNKVLANISMSLKQFELICEIINDDETAEPFKKDQVHLPNGGLLYREKFPNPGEFDARKLIDVLFAKIQKLTAVAAQVSRDFTMTHETEALVTYLGLISSNMKSILFDASLTEESLLIDDVITLDAAVVPTREEIKRISAAIYKECSVDPDLAPAATKK